MTDFIYTSEPHAAPRRKQLKPFGNSRDDEPQTENTNMNLMIDPRVIRGNTFSAKILSSSLKELTVVKNRNNRNISPLKKRKGKRDHTPPPVEGRIHIDIQTETFLEELSDRPIEKDAETQTHLFLDRPPSPLFIPIKSGIDAETQIQPGDLFVFDLEVEPLLQVLVGKTVESAMLDLMQDEELEAIRKQQLEYEMIRDSEIAEVKRLEAESIRKHQEKERRVEQAKQRKVERKLLDDKIASKRLAHELWNGLQNQLFDELESEGYFYNPIEREIEESFLPGLFLDVKFQLSCFEAAETLTLDILLSVEHLASEFESNEITERKKIDQDIEDARARELDAEKQRKEEAVLAKAKALEAKRKALEETVTEAGEPEEEPH